MLAVGILASLSTSMAFVDALDPYCQAPLGVGTGTGGAGTSLAMAIIIARHGDRTPANLLPDEGAISWNGCGVGRTDTMLLDGSKTAFSGFSYSPAPLSSPYAKGMWQGDCKYF